MEDENNTFLEVGTVFDAEANQEAIGLLGMAELKDLARDCDRWRKEFVLKFALLKREVERTSQ